MFISGSWWTCTLPSPSAGRVRVVVIQRPVQEKSVSFNSSRCAVVDFHQEMKDLLLGCVAKAEFLSIK
jgi:hypothetical protein